MWDFIKRKKWLISGLLMFTLAMGILGVQLVPVQQVQNHNPIIVGIGQKIFTVGTVDASGTVDYVCDGVNDNVQLQGALDALPANGGEIDILSGNYSFGATVTRAIPNVTIKGVGAATYIAYNATNYIFTAGGNNWQISNLKVDNGSMNMGATTGWNWENVTVNTIYYAYRTSVSSSSWVIPTGRTSSWVIAAYNSPASVQAQADVVCTSTNFNTVLASAISAGYHSFSLSEGTFGESATALVNADYISIIGQGSSTKVVANGNYPTFSFVGTSGANRMQPMLKNMQIWGYDNTGASTSADGILLTWVHTGDFENLFFYNCYDAIHLQRAWRTTFTNLQANGASSGDKCYRGLYMERQDTSHNYIEMYNSIFVNTLSVPITIRDCSGSIFNGVEAGGNTAGHAWDIGNGDASSHVEYLNLTDCLADTTPVGSYDGFHIEKGSSGTLINIHINNIWAGTIQGRNAVNAIGVEDLQIIGGTIAAIAQHAIALSGCTGSLITDVHFSAYGATSYDGIYSTTSDKIRVIGNHFNSTSSRRDITKDGSGGWVITDNYMTDGGSSAPKVSGATKAAGDIFSHNVGWITENSGQASGTGSQQTIAHGLGFTPTYDQIALTMNSAGTAYESAAPDATNIYVTATGGSTFTWSTTGR